MRQEIKIKLLQNMLEEVTKKYDYFILKQDQMIKQTYDMATKDKLTTLYNRQYLEDYAKQAFDRMQRHNHVLILIFIDIDNFKYVNDTFGHNMGDEILINTANILRRNLKGKDIIGRFGGDEFVVAIENCNKECATTTLKKIQEDINNFFKTYNVTTSIGVAFYPEINDYNKLLKAADKKMYKSKKEGKNKISL